MPLELLLLLLLLEVDVDVPEDGESVVPCRFLKEGAAYTRNGGPANPLSMLGELNSCNVVSFGSSHLVQAARSELAFARSTKVT